MSLEHFYLGHWNLFEIWNLIFVIYITSEDEGSPESNKFPDENN